MTKYGQLFCSCSRPLQGYTRHERNLLSSQGHPAPRGQRRCRGRSHPTRPTRRPASSSPPRCRAAARAVAADEAVHAAHAQQAFEDAKQSKDALVLRSARASSEAADDERKQQHDRQKDATIVLGQAPGGQAAAGSRRRCGRAWRCAGRLRWGGARLSRSRSLESVRLRWGQPGCEL